MDARLTLRIEGPDAAILATAVGPDLESGLPGATIALDGSEGFVVKGSEPAAFRAAANTVFRLLTTAAGVASASPDEE